MFGEKLFTGVGYPTPVSIPDETTCLLIQVPANDEWWALMTGLLYDLTLEWNWQQYEGGVDRDVAAAKWAEIFNQAVDLAAVSNTCSLTVGTPFWDDTNGDDADDEEPVDDQEWYGELETDGITWREQVGIWAITGMVAIAATPAAAIAFLPLANRFVLAFHQHDLGGIVRVLINATEIAQVDTYAPVDGVRNIIISNPAPAMLLLDDAPQMLIVMSEDVNPAVEGTPNIQVIRKRLDQSEVTPSNIRWDATCDCVQQTIDGGATWVDSPTQDPRRSTIFQTAPRTTGDPKCDSAQQMHDRVKNALDALIASSSILQAINAVVGVVSVFLFEIGIIIEALWAVISAIFGVGTTVLDAALDATAYDQLLCILYCNIGADGSVTEDQYNAIISKINLEINSVAAFAFTTFLSGIGWVGLSNAGALGEVTGDCSDCGCEWCYNFDWTADKFGWSTFAYPDNWQLGDGWVDVYWAAANDQGMGAQISFDETTITHLEMEFNGFPGGATNSILWLYLGGVEQMRVDIPWPTGTPSRTVEWDGAISADTIYCSVLCGVGSGDGSCNAFRFEVHGEGTNPFGTDNC